MSINPYQAPRHYATRRHFVHDEFSLALFATIVVLFAMPVLSSALIGFAAAYRDKSWGRVDRCWTIVAALVLFATWSWMAWTVATVAWNLSPQ